MGDDDPKPRAAPLTQQWGYPKDTGSTRYIPVAEGVIEAYRRDVESLRQDNAALRERIKELELRLDRDE